MDAVVNATTASDAPAWHAMPVDDVVKRLSTDLQ